MKITGRQSALQLSPKSVAACQRHNIQKLKLVSQVVFWHLNQRPLPRIQQTTPAQAKVVSLMAFQSPEKLPRSGAHSLSLSPLSISQLPKLHTKKTVLLCMTRVLLKRQTETMERVSKRKGGETERENRPRVRSLRWHRCCCCHQEWH